MDSPTRACRSRQGSAAVVLLLSICACGGRRSILDPPDAGTRDGSVDFDASVAGCEDVCRCPVQVDEGTFEMGAEALLDCSGLEPCTRDYLCNHAPVHEVFESEFFINRFEAAVGCYAECVISGDCSPPEQINDLFPPPSYWTDPANFLRPALGIFRDQSADYCRFLGGRLPSEAEWEKAARGTDGRAFSWGDDPPTCEHADLWRDRSGDSACPPDGDPAFPLPVTDRPIDESPWGVRGMVGGAYEWVADEYSPDYYEAEKAWSDPLGPDECACAECPAGVRRGSYYGGPIGPDAIYSACFVRTPFTGARDMGVRCVWDSPEDVAGR